MPVWTSKDGKHIEVVASRKELYEKSVNKPTRVIFVRHGESEKNIKDLHSSVLDKYPLTKVGEKQADFTRNGIINLEDLIIFVPVWLRRPGQENWYTLCDLYEDEQIDLVDWADFAKDWLWQASWHVE